jgi:hypothetical protein
MFCGKFAPRLECRFDPRKPFNFLEAIFESGRQCFGSAGEMNVIPPHPIHRSGQLAKKVAAIALARILSLYSLYGVPYRRKRAGNPHQTNSGIDRSHHGGSHIHNRP